MSEEGPSRADALAVDGSGLCPRNSLAPRVVRGGHLLGGGSPPFQAEGTILRVSGWGRGRLCSARSQFTWTAVAEPGHLGVETFFKTPPQETLDRHFCTQTAPAGCPPLEARYPSARLSSA